MYSKLYKRKDVQLKMKTILYSNDFSYINN